MTSSEYSDMLKWLKLNVFKSEIILVWLFIGLAAAASSTWTLVLLLTTVPVITRMVKAEYSKGWQDGFEFGRKADPKPYAKAKAMSDKEVAEQYWSA